MLVLRRSLALVRKDFLLYAADPLPVVLMMVMPLGFVAFLVPLNRALLEAQGYEGVTGAEQVLPGMMVMFGLFLLGIAGDQFYREHGWGTWERSRVAADAPEIILGKVVPALAVLLFQLVIVLLAGSAVYGMRVAGPVSAVLLIVAALSVCLMTILVAQVAWCATFAQFNAVNVLMVMTFSGLGGAFAPVSLMPSWVQSLARFTPAYWAIEGLRDVMLEGAGLGPASGKAAILLLFAAAFTGLAAVRFRIDEAKISNA